ncbi:MAG TPA: histone deacetylase, partial [Solirubrobacteraceae bacterium]|nr:histone deacetylase [Solirubrobacteraceae bacterium]
MLYVHHPASLEHDPRAYLPEHPDVPERVDAIERAMERVGWLGCEVREAPAASVRELELVHSASHVRGVFGLCAAGGGQLDAETFVDEASCRAASYAAGGACEMVR